MTSSGNFSVTPFYKAISRILHTSGIMEIWNLAGGSSYTVYVKAGNLRCIRKNKEFASPLESKAILMELLSAKEGLYEVQETTFKTPMEPSLKWPLEKVLISLTIVDEEIKYKTVELSPADIKYQVSAGWLEPELEKTFFWQQALPLLESGATGAEIAGRLRLSEGMVCYYLAKLERAYMIEQANDPIAQARKTMELSPDLENNYLTREVELPVKVEREKAETTDLLDVDFVFE